MENLKIGQREIGWDGMDWIYLAEDREHWQVLVDTVINLCANLLVKYFVECSTEVLCP
jgi:hypothetical protein